MCLMLILYIQPKRAARKRPRLTHKKHPDAPKRNRTAYILFMMKYRPIVKEKLGVRVQVRHSRVALDEGSDAWWLMYGPAHV